MPQPAEPEPLRESLARALPYVEAMGACAEKRRRYEDRYQDTYAAYAAAAAEAESLYGPAPPAARFETRDRRCRARDFSSYEGISGLWLNEAQRWLSLQASRMPGLWVGMMPVCGKGVAAAATIEGDSGPQLPALRIDLAPRLHARLLAETKGRVGKQMSVRIDGKPIMEPMLYEPLSVGSLMLSAPDRAELERIRAAALSPCSGGSDGIVLPASSARPIR